MYECRCDERLKTKAEESTRLRLRIRIKKNSFPKIHQEKKNSLNHLTHCQETPESGVSLLGIGLTMRCSGHKIVLLLYILEIASGFSRVPYVPKTVVLRCSGPFMDAPKGDDRERERQDWITFFQRAHEMTEEDVAAQIKTPAVLQAFERARLSTLPDDVRAAYEAEVREHDRYAQHTAELTRMAKIEVAQKLLAMNLTVDQIEKATGLSSEDIKSIM
jgi:hypothetical protein